MKLRNKILVVFILFILLLMGTAFGTVLYFYNNPSTIKPFLERSISITTSTSFSMQSFSFSLRPLNILAKGLNFIPSDKSESFLLNVPRLSMDLALEGPFGGRTLIIEKLMVNGLSMQISDESTLPEMGKRTPKTGVFYLFLKKFADLLLFRDIRFHELEIIDGKIHALLQGGEVQINSLMGEMTLDQHIKVSGRSSFHRATGEISLDVPEFSFTTNKTISFDKPIVGTLYISNAMLFSPMVELRQIDQEAVFSYDHRDSKIEIESLMFRCPNILFNGENKGQNPLQNISLKMDGGMIDFRNLSFHIKDFMLRLNSILRSEGQLNLDLGPPVNLTLVSRKSSLNVEELLRLLPSSIKDRFAPIQISGPLIIKGNLNIVEREKTWDFPVDLLIELKNNPYDLSLEKLHLSGNIGGEIKMEGDIRDLGITTDLNIENSMFSGNGMHLDPFTVSLSVSGKYPVFILNRLKTSFPRITLKNSGGLLEFKDIEILTDTGEFNVEDRKAHFPQLFLSSSLIGDIILSLEYNKDKSILNIKGENINIPQFLSTMGYVPAGWNVKGSDKLEINTVFMDNRNLTFQSSLYLSGLGFENPDGTIIGDNISLDMSMEGGTDLQEPRIKVKGQVRSKNGELLYDRFYFNFKNNPIYMETMAEYDTSKKTAHLIESELTVRDIVTLYAKGDLKEQNEDYILDLNFDIPDTSLKPIFKNFLLDPFKLERPFLSDLDMNGHILAGFDLGLDSNHRELKGYLILKNMELTLRKTGISLSDVNLELPIWYYSNGITGNTAPLQGLLTIQKLGLPNFPEQDVTFSLAAFPNSVAITSPTIFKVPGGEVLMGPLEFKDIFSSAPSAETSLDIDDLEMAPFLSMLGLNDVNGVIFGKLDPISMNANDISSRGELKAKLFNGEVYISGIQATGIFTPSPLLKSDITWSNLDLGAITTGTAFGEIQGLLDGHLKNLEIAYGQPQRFDLLMETREKKGIQQKISVKAVDNIARIGGGQSPFMGLAGSFATLFKEFPYEKIGIHASLENDVFRINGTIFEDGLEYIIKRKGFSGVNVVNQNPDNRISFKDMIRRIKRVTSSSQGPVIK